MSTINATETAKSLSARLEAATVRVKHTHCLDLIAAACGLKNRHLMNTTALVRPEAPNRDLLEQVAIKFATHDEERRNTIIQETLSVIYPETSTPTVEFSFAGVEVELKPEDIRTVEAFINSEAGAKVLEAIADDESYTRYYRHGNDPSLSSKSGNELAHNILEGLREGEDPRDILEEFFQYRVSVEDYFSYNYVSDKIRGMAEDILDLAQENDLPFDDDTSEWVEALKQPILDLIEDQDDSCVTEMLYEMDEAELVFVLQNPDAPTIEDALIYSTKPWTDPAHLAIRGELQHPLASLGYTVSDFRKHFGNKVEAYGLKHGIRRRREPLMTPDQLRSTIENACNQYFVFVLYSIVPIKDLLNLDLTKPLTFSNAEIGVYNPYSGTYYGEVRVKDITVSPQEGHLQSCHRGCSPDEICGLVRRYFGGNITQPKS